jgi:hypothetical protein
VEVEMEDGQHDDERSDLRPSYVAPAETTRGAS